MEEPIINSLIKQIEKIGEDSAFEKFSLKIDDKILESGILDSPGIIKLVLFIESKYNIQVEQDEMNMDNFESVITLEKYIRGKFNENE